MDNRNDQYWDDIDAYLDGELRGAEREAFRRRLSEEPALAKDTLFQREMRQGIAYGSQEELRGRLQTIHAETVGKPAGGRVVPLGGSLWPRWVAAAALLVGALGILFWLQQRPLDTAAVFAANYEVYEVDYTTRGTGAADPAAALEAYRAKDYPTAIRRLEEALEADPAAAPLRLALAVSYWEDGQRTRARTSLKPLFEHPLLNDRAYWYAGLFALAEGDRKMAIGHFSQVSADGGPLSKRAATLRERLR